MRALYRVKNSKNQTVGFMTDNGYVKYYNALKNILLIDNLTVTKDNIIKSKNKKLNTLSVKEVNNSIYRNSCKKNRLDRDIQKSLYKWKEKRNNLVLYLTGARQTGKTTELLKFAYKNYEQIIYINLANEEALNNFENIVLSNSIQFGMINYCRRSLLEEFSDDKHTIIIIDEIQESYKVYNSIRSLQSELNCDIAVTGSYLGKTLNSKYFKPAGNMYELEMLPLSFTEFCRAFHMEEELYSIDLYGNSEKDKYVKLTELYRVYRQIGGYPAVVDNYMKTKDIDDCFEIIKTIVDRFNEESASYFTDHKCSVIFQNVYKAAFLSIAKEKKGTSSTDIKDITEFVKYDTKEHVSRSEINKAISWLKYSKIIGSCDLYNQGDVTDLLSERRFYFMDCGIANYIAHTTPMKNSDIEGVMTENFAYSELYRLYKTNLVKGDIPCCSVYKQFELDFMVVDHNDIRYGIEVKTSNSNDPKSLNMFLKEKLIDKAYIAGITRSGVRENIRAIPIYTIGCRFPY